MGQPNGSSRSAAPCRTSATTRKKLPRRSTTGSSLAARERRCPTCKPLQPNAAFFDAAASPIITTRRSRTCALSTKALLVEFHWSFQMTPKQRKAKSAYERERRRLHRLHRFEAAARTRGFSFVAGIDEVGRGPLAGPVVAACVVATEPLFIKGLNDSKLVRADLRLEIAEIVKVRAAAWAIGSACVAEIDRLNIYWASVLAMERAIAALPALPEYLITDAVRIRSFAGPQEPLIHGDARCAVVAAASIVAKVHRDGLMVALDGLDPRYGFALHKGYSTPQHIEALRVHGPSVHHRANWARVRDAQLALGLESLEALEEFVEAEALAPRDAAAAG